MRVLNGMDEVLTLTLQALRNRLAHEMGEEGTRPA